jgi:tripartite motif-containing protein 71
LKYSFAFIIFISALSYNQPKFCSSASWNPNAITFANISLVGLKPYGIFVNSNNTVYVTNHQNGLIQIWMNNTINPTRTITGSLVSPFSIFVTTNGDIYVDNGLSNGRVDKWTLNLNTSVPVMYVNSSCNGLFVDINDTLYCSIYHRNQVVKKWLNDSTNTSTIVAGTGINGSASNMLNQPVGIFVDINFDLYVADHRNHRIQLFPLGQSNGITVAGNGSSTTTIILNLPTGVVLDTDKYLFIADQNNHRIVGSGSNGFRCLVGCPGSSGTASNQLSSPRTLSFDSAGNMFVIDRYNDRIQKFSVLNNSCGE